MSGRKNPLSAAQAPAADTFKILAEESPNVIFINKMGSVVYANKKAVDLMGYSREEFYAPDFDFMSLVAPEFHARTRRNLKMHMRGREVPPFEYAIMTKDGRKIEAIIATKLVAYEGGAAILGVVTDVSRLKRAEAQLRRSEERWRSLLEQSVSHITIVGPDERIEFMNRRPSGRDVREAVGRPICEFMAPESHPALRAAIRRAFMGREPSTLELIAEVKGRRWWFQTHVGPICDGDSVHSVVLSSVDITDAKKAEDGLRQAQKLASLGRLSAGLAHEINNPLSALSGEVQMVLERARDPKLAASLRFMGRVSSRIENIVKGLLEFSRQDPAADRQPVRIHDVLERTLKLVERRMRLAGIRVVQRYGRPMPLLHANRGQLEQVFMNVILNSRDAMPGGGVLTVSTRKAPGGFVEVAVSDTGAGIAREHLDHVFEPFFSTKDPGRGTGLGLPISHGIVSRHGGTIRISSEAGRGARVFVRLPVAHGGNGKGNGKG